MGDGPMCEPPWQVPYLAVLALFSSTCILRAAELQNPGDDTDPLTFNLQACALPTPPC